MNQIQVPDHVKEKILKFFVKTSAPRIIAKEIKAKQEVTNERLHQR